MSLNLKALQTFHLIVREGSLAAAAKKMNLSQPAASRLIRILEAETKLQLFSRARRRLVLTVEGELFYREAEHILHGVDEIPRIADDIRKRTTAQLRVMTSAPIGLSLIAPALALFHTEHPDIRCVADIGSRFELESMVGTRRYDLSVVSLPISHSSVELDNAPLCRARTAVLLPRGHPLATKSSLAASDLSGESMIALTPNLLWRQRSDEFFRAGGVTPTYAMETQSTLIARQLVNNGAGIALMDQIVGGPSAPEGAVMIPLDPERWVSYGYVFPKDQPRDANAELFIKALRRVIETRCADNTGHAKLMEPESASVPIPKFASTNFGFKGTLTF